MNKKETSSLVDMIKDETFDMARDEIQKVGYHAVGIVGDYFQNIRNTPILPDKTLKQMKDLLKEPLPQNGQDPLLVLDECKEKIISC